MDHQTENSAMDFKGKTALITGSCGTGMGRSTAFCLAAQGANVVLNHGTYRRGDVMDESAARIAEAVEELGGKALVQPANTRDEAEVMAMLKAVRERFGPIDILVNNTGGPFRVRDYADIPLEEWRDTLSAEIDSPFLLMKHIVPGMRERKWGRVIHMGVDKALRGDPAPAVDYNLGKAARSWMALAFAAKEWPHGVTMNCVEPGYTPAMAFETALGLARGTAQEGEVALFQPETERILWQGPWGERPGPCCHDVAELVTFLASEKGRFLTGELIGLPWFPED
jgi:NAD(P)-dependent dehydrogenase (short-subunit alcohol dehydrogenase family)